MRTNTRKFRLALTWLMLVALLSFLVASSASAATIELGSLSWSVQYMIDQSQSVFGDSQFSGPRDNRGLALSPDGRYLYAGYNNPSSGASAKQVRKIDTTIPDYIDATIAVLKGFRGKAIATDDVGRVYLAEGSAGIYVYDPSLATQLATIPVGTTYGLSKPEGVAATREDGVLVLYVTDRANKTLTRFKITESPGYAISDITKAGEITITGASDLRGVEVDRSGRIWMADCGEGKVFRVNSDGTGLTYVTVPNAMDIGFDDTYAFVTQYTERTITVLRQSDMSFVTTLTPPWEQLKLDPDGESGNGALSGIAIGPGSFFYVANEAGQTADEHSTYGRIDGQSGYIGGIYYTDTTHDDNEPILKAMAPPAEVWVDVDYCEGCTNDGHTWGYDAFNKIQDGIDAVAEGGTVYVAAGTYNEYLVIQKSVHLIGEDKNTTILTYTGTPAVEQLIMLGWNRGGTLAGGVTIQGFKLLADVGLTGDKDLIKLRANGTSSGPIVIKDNIFQGDGITRYLGIETAYDAGYVKVENNEFDDLAYGAWFNVLTNGEIKGNTITDAIYTGLALCTSDLDKIHDVDIVGNTILRSTTYTDAALHPEWAVWYSGMHIGSTVYNVNITDNIIADGNYYAIVFHNRGTTNLSNVHINNNCIYGNPHGSLNEVATSVTLDAENNWWGDPSGSVKQRALAKLNGIYPTGENKVNHRLEKAIEHIEKSLDSKYWVDDGHLDAKHGNKVFDEEKKAVKELMKLIDKKDMPQDVQEACQEVIDELIRADYMLARTAIDEASAAGDPKEIAKAEEEMAKAQEELEHTKKDGTPDPHYDKAIDHYKKAWEHACKAQKLKEVGPKAVEDQLRVVMSPNPIRDVHTAHFYVLGAMADEVEEIRVQIYDLSGRLVWEDTAPGSELEWHTEDLSGTYLANGVYLYKVQIRVDGSWISQELGKIVVLR